MADTKKAGERLLSPQDDLEILFRRLYPGLPFKDALYLHINKQTKEQEKKDLDQNKLINAQSNEINKLSNFVKTMGTELQDFENLSKQNDQDIERLKQLAGTIRAGGEERKETIKISDKELQALRADLETLRQKPGVDPEQLKSLQSEVEKAKQGKASSEEVQKLQQGLDALTKQPRLDPTEVQKTIQDIKKGYEGAAAGVSAELENALKDLDEKERRFEKSVQNNRKERKEYSAKYDQLRQEVAATEESVRSLTGLKKYMDGFLTDLNNTMQAYEQSLGAKAKKVDQLLDRAEVKAEEATFAANELERLLNQEKARLSPGQVGKRDFSLVKGMRQTAKPPAPQQKVARQNTQSPENLPSDGELPLDLDFPDEDDFRPKRA